MTTSSAAEGASKSIQDQLCQLQLCSKCLHGHGSHAVAEWVSERQAISFESAINISCNQHQQCYSNATHSANKAVTSFGQNLAQNACVFLLLADPPLLLPSHVAVSASRRLGSAAEC